MVLDPALQARHVLDHALRPLDEVLDVLEVPAPVLYINQQHLLLLNDHFDDCVQLETQCWNIIH